MPDPRENILERLRTIKPALQQEFPLRRMALFGSWARNEQTETSDVDILVEVDPSINEPDRTGFFRIHCTDCNDDKSATLRVWLS